MGKYKYIVVLLLIVHLAILSLFVLMRLADADEGFYMNAARMVHQGMSVYTDIFYTQLPMMPTIFAPLADGGWSSFFTLRIMAALAGFLSALLLSLIILKTTRDYKTTVIALVFYVFSGMIIVWHTTFKPLPFCNLLSIGTFFFWLLYYEKRRLLYLFLTGLFLSALVNFRTVFIVLLPLYFISVIYLSKKDRVKNLSVFIISLIPFALPTLMAIISSPEHFRAGNIFFQLNREVQHGLGAVLSNRLDTFVRLVVDPQISIIFVITIISLGILFIHGRIKSIINLVDTPHGMALMNLLLIGGVYLLPHPMSRQYVNQYLAFAIILIAFNLKYILNGVERFMKPLTRKLLMYGLAAVYLLSLIPYTAIFIYGIRKDDRRYVISEMKKISSQMLQQAGEDAVVLSEWPGYTFLTKQSPLRYTEIFGGEHKLPLTHDEYMKYKICDSTYLIKEVSNKTPDLVVTLYHPPVYYASVLENNYDKTYNSDVVTIYKRK